MPLSISDKEHFKAIIKEADALGKLGRFAEERFINPVDGESPSDWGFEEWPLGYTNITLALGLGLASTRSIAPICSLGWLKVKNRPAYDHLSADEMDRIAKANDTQLEDGSPRLPAIIKVIDSLEE